MLELNDMNQRIDKEKARGTKLKQKVQLHVSLKTEDQVRELHVFDYILIQEQSDYNTQEVGMSSFVQ